MMKAPRLLPVVIAATSALLLLKGIGLMTSGGYVLVGTQQAQAAGAAPAADHGATASGGDPTMELPPEHTLEDSSPTLTDESPVLALGGEEASGGHGATSAASGDHSEPAADHAEALPPDPAASAPEDILQAACPPTDSSAAAEGGDHGGEPAAEAPTLRDCIPVPLNAYGDALAMELNESGQLVPVEGNPSSADDILTRLGERRDTLDEREKELEMRLALIEAAEKRLEERTAALKVLEARVNALVEEKKSDEKEQFAGIVAMYETMKPKEAAAIFDTLDTQMLVRVARAMNPRKVAPILARMEPMKAKALTSGLAREEAEPTLDAAAVEDLANLPQIIGQ